MFLLQLSQLSQHFHHVFVDAHVSWSMMLCLDGRSILWIIFVVTCCCRGDGTSYVFYGVVVWCVWVRGCCSTYFNQLLYFSECVLKLVFINTVLRTPLCTNNEIFLFLIIKCKLYIWTICEHYGSSSICLFHIEIAVKMYFSVCYILFLRIFRRPRAACWPALFYIMALCVLDLGGTHRVSLQGGGWGGVLLR